MKRYILIIGAILLGFTLKAQSVTYACRFWFDQNHAQAVTTPFSDSIWQTEIDVGSLADGMHTLYIHVMDTSMKWSAPKSYLFFKIDETLPEYYLYHCWFDQDFDNQQSGAIGDGSFLLDVADIEEGLHTVNVIVEGHALTSTKCYLFFKMPVADPNIEQQYICWFDDDYSTMQTGLLGDGSFILDVDGLSSGIHTVNIQVDKGTSSSPKSYFFFKTEGIKKWEYCINGNWENRITTEIEITDTLDIVGLLPVETQSIRSTCFQFHPNGDNPEIFAKNEITFRFWDAGKYFKDETKFYIDENVAEEIQADTFGRNSTETISAPRNNQIIWFKLDVGVGDSLSFVANKACTMQLFAPSGEEVYNVLGPESVAFGGIHAWEDGTYYLAIHDVMGSGETVSVTYQYLHKYAILAYDVHLVGNGGCSTITFQGNGFNSLLDAYLVNYQNDTIHRLDIGHESNTTTTVTFDFYQVNLGVYDAVFQFYGETVRVNGTLEVQEPVDIVLNSSVSYPSQFLRNTPCTYTFTITNTGNMSAYAVPIYVYLSTNTIDGISLIDFDGLKLPSLIDGMDLDTLSPSRIEELKKISDVIGDIHHFFIHKTTDEVTGDSIIARSNFFFLNIAPYETKTLTLKITANESLDVWMTVPNDVVSPLTLHPDRGDWFGSPWCCVKDNWTCLVNTICEVINIANLISDLFPGSPAQLYTAIASCICGGISTGLSIFTYWKCEGDGNFINMVSDLTNSISGTVASCASIFIPSVDEEDAIIVKGLIENIIASITSSVSGGISVNESCFVEKKKKPNCPDGDDNGGESEAVNSLDPNDIYGYLSESGSHYMRQEIQNVQYEIEFENDTTLATAAAHTIIVRDTLNRSRFDLNSLAARSVTIGDKRLDLNGEQTFARTLDLRPEQYVIAQIEQDYNPTTGIIQWTIQSLDPMTIEPTDDPNQGVLPVNYNGNGVGFIDYSVNLKQAFADGTKIRNRAGIIFDQNDVIMTPIWTNIVDAVKPTSHIEEVEVVNDSLSFSFVSEDNRSGVWYHTLYHRNNFTEMQWQVRKPQVFGNCLMLPIDSLFTTEYLVIAVDSAGNREEKEMVAEYTYFSSIPITVTQTNTLSRGWNWYSTYIEQEGIDGLGQLENSIGVPKAIIQSQGDGYVKSVLRNGRVLWGGALSSINNEEMYKIGTKYICSATMEGVVTNPASHPITINKGWNWIGFPCDHSVSVTEALSGFTPRNKDVIKGLNSYATYRNGAWVGTLNTLEPGQGYMYGSGSNTPKTLVFQTGRGETTLANITPENNFYQPTEDFADNMTLTAVIELDGEELRSDDYELAAFVGDECRGSVKLMYVEPINRYAAFLTVFGDETEDLYFVLTDGTDMSQSEDYVRYETDGMVGSLGEPVTLRFGTLGLSDGMRLPVHIYPNPSKDVFNIEGVGIRKVEVTNAYGQVILSEEVENDNLQINLSDKAAGAYLLRVVTDRGVTTKKLVKE